MKAILFYLKARWPLGAALVLCAAVFVSVCLLENLPLHRFGYGFLLMGVLLFLLALADFYFFAAHLSSLNRLKKQLDGNDFAFPQKVDSIIKTYQDIIMEQHKKINQLENNLNENAADSLDYYTLWMHQIKTPIAAMSLMLSEGQTPIKNELFKIEQYVEMALTYLRLNTPETDYVFTWVKVDDIIKKALRKYANLFIMRKISLSYEATSESALSDGKWLQFIIEQLLSNAIKYTKEGGQITITCEHLTLCVSDTGIGIAKEDLPRVFDKGYTGFNGRSHEKSTGIGLYLVKKATERLGNPISIQSEIGKGTKVTLNLNRENLTRM